jgi:hypothetical protein
MQRHAAADGQVACGQQTGNSQFAKHAFINGSFFFQRFGIGARRGRHPVNPQGPVAENGCTAAAYRRFFAPQRIRQNIRRLLSRQDNRPAFGQLVQRIFKIKRTDHLQKPVRSIPPMPDNFHRRIPQSNALFRQESAKKRLVERLPVFRQEMIPVAKEYRSENPPHVILKIRIKEIHFPARFRRRKTAQHQYFGAFREKGRQGMGFRETVGIHFFISIRMT